MIIKEVELKDVPQIVSLWQEFMDEHDEIIIAENPLLKDIEIKDKDMQHSYRAFLTSHIKSDSGAVFIALENNIIVSYALVFVKDEIPIYQNKKIGYISDLFVKKNSGIIQ